MPQPQGTYHPTEVLKAWRQEYPHRFDDVDDGTLLDAIKTEDPETYKLVDPRLIGAELLGDSRKGPEAAPPAKPLPVYHPPPSTAERVLTTVPRVGGMLVGGAVGAYAGAPTIGAMAGGGVGELAAEKLEEALGTRDAVSPTEVGVQTALGAYQPIATSAGVVGRTALRTAEGAMLGTAGDLTEQFLTNPNAPPQFRSAAALGGAATGAAFHGAGEAYGAVTGAAPSFGDFGLPTDQVPSHPAVQAARAAQIQQFARDQDAAEISREFVKRGWDVPDKAGLQYGLEAKDYLAQIAALKQPPVAIPPITDVPPAAPPQLALPPSPIVSYPAGVEPPTDDLSLVVGANPPLQSRVIQNQSTGDRLEDQLYTNLMTSPEPPRLSTQKQLQLRGEVPPAPTAVDANLLEAPAASAPPARPQRLIQKRASSAQPYLPEATRPRPLDRTYAEGPNAGPRREGELHAEPRSTRRRVYAADGSYTMETAPSTLHAEDPGTYPPEVRREMARMLYELQEHPHERIQGGSTQGQLEALATDIHGTTADAVAEAKRRGATSGGAIPGAPVYHNIIDAAKGARAHATREEMIQDLHAALTEGKGSSLSDAAAQVARGRIEQEARGGTTPEGYKAGQFRNNGATRRQGYPVISAPGAGDHLIGWTDESGAQALPEQDLAPEDLDAREASDSELLQMRRLGQQHGVPEGLEPHYAAVDRELWRRGLISGEQGELGMEGPGGAGGPSLLDFEGGPPKKPTTKQLTPEQETGVTNLEHFLAHVHGEDFPTVGNGTFKEPAAQQPDLPGTEGVRDTHNPTPEVADLPFALSPPPEKPAARRRSNVGAPAAERPGLLRRLLEEDGVLILNVPAGDRKGLKSWLAKQEDEHGTEAWYSRVEQAISDGDWDRAWKVAASASTRSYAAAYDAAKDPRAEAALRQAVKGTPLQADIQTEIIGAARKKGIPKDEQAPTVTDFPPSYQVSQAGAARGKAKLGPAGVITPGPPQKPLEGKYTDQVLSRGLQRSIIEDTDPELIHLIPGNADTNLRLYRQVADLSFRGANTKEVKQYLHLSNEEIAQHFLRSVQEAGRTLQQLSAYAQMHESTLHEAAEAMSMGGALEGMLGGPPSKVVGARGRVIGRVGTIDPSRTLDALAEPTKNWDQAMLTATLQKPKGNEFELLQAASYPFMISKWATAVRNAVTQAGRYGVDTLDEALTLPLAKLLGDEGSADMAGAQARERVAAVGRGGNYVSPTRAWKETVQDIYDITADTLGKLDPDDSRATLKVLSEFPTEASHFLGAVGSAGEDVSEGKSRFRLVNSLLDPKLQRLLTVFNRAQEFTGRALVFDASMRGQLRARGLDPLEVLQLPTDQLTTAVGGPQALQEILENSVAGALEATFASRTAKNSIPAALVRFVNTAWPLKLGYPFPGFNLARAPRFVWDHGPWALMDLVRFPVDHLLNSQGGGRLTRGVRAQQYETKAIPELVGKRQASTQRLGEAVRDLVASRRELAVRTRMVSRLEARQAKGLLPETDGSLADATDLRDQLSRRVERAKQTIGTEKSTIRDLSSQEEKLLDAVRDAHGIGAPTLPQYFARIGTGTFGLLGAAFVIRSQDGAQGTRWYEYRIDRKGKDPTTLDFRPFAPFAQYLFVADVMQDFYHHTDWQAAKAEAEDPMHGPVAGPIDWSRAVWNHYTGKYTGQELGAQFAQAFLSMSRAAGTTLTITDLLTQNGWPSLQDAADSIIGTVGQFLSRFTVPAQQLKDLAGAFDPEEAKARITPRATLDEPYRPLADPLANIPYVSEAIPERISQTTGKPVATEYPLLRALAGIGTAPKDFVTQEVQRVGVPGASVFIRETGDYPLDRTIAESYSRILAEHLPEILESEQYRALGTPADQRDYLQRWIFPALKRAALGEVRQGMGEAEYQGAMVKGETARRKQRQQDLLTRLDGELGPAPVDSSDVPDQPPGPPSAAESPAAAPPGRP